MQAYYRTMAVERDLLVGYPVIDIHGLTPEEVCVLLFVFVGC